MPKATIIVAMDRHGGIGAKGTLPWRVRSEMQHFYNTTTHAPAGKINAVIMGRRTWESLPHRLSKRLNIVVSRRTQPGVHDGALWVNSLEDAFNKADEFGDVHTAFILGGTSLFEEACKRPELEACIVSLMDTTDTICDTFFPLAVAEQAGWGRLNEVPPSAPQWTRDAENGISFVVTHHMRHPASQPEPLRSGNQEPM